MHAAWWLRVVESQQRAQGTTFACGLLLLVVHCRAGPICASRACVCAQLRVILVSMHLMQ
jgi:hypothetical protein